MAAEVLFALATARSNHPTSQVKVSAMLSKRRPSARNKRSHKNRFSNNFLIESLERREMFAADLTGKTNELVASPVTTNSPFAAVSGVTAGGVTIGSTGTTTADFVVDPNKILTNGELQQVPPTLGATF